MRAKSLDFPPIDGKAIDQIVDEFFFALRSIRDVSVAVFVGSQNGVMTKDSLKFE